MNPKYTPVIYAVSIAAVISCLLLALTKPTNAQDVEIARIRAQAAADARQADKEQQVQRLDCMERVMKTLGPDAMKSTGIQGTQTELQRLCK